VNHYRGAHLEHAILDGANFDKVEAPNANFSHASCIGMTFRDGDATSVQFESANLAGSDLSRTGLRGANFSGAKLFGCTLHGNDISGASFDRTEGLGTIRGLELLPFQNDERPEHFETCCRSWFDRWLDWERIRVAGRLPLFGASYTLILLIPLFYFGLDFYNQKVDLARTWASSVVEGPEPLPQLARVIDEKLCHAPIPRQSMLLLISTVCLAIASSTYHFACPSRIKEFSSDQWRDELGHNLIHYWPLSWKRPWLRIGCAILYVLGGLGAAWVIVWKIIWVGEFICRNQ
jgi:hypothetical protein